MLNMSRFICPSCTQSHDLFGPPDAFRGVAARLGLPVLGELPLVPKVAQDSDAGVPFMLSESSKADSNSNSMSVAEKDYANVMREVATKIWQGLVESKKQQQQQQKR